MDWDQPQARWQLWEPRLSACSPGAAQSLLWQAHCHGRVMRGAGWGQAQAQLERLAVGEHSGAGQWEKTGSDPSHTRRLRCGRALRRLRHLPWHACSSGGWFRACAQLELTPEHVHGSGDSCRGLGWCPVSRQTWTAELAIIPEFWQTWEWAGTCDYGYLWSASWWKRQELQGGCTGLLVALETKSAGFACRTDHWERNFSCYMTALGSPGLLSCSCISVASQLRSLVQVKPNQDLSSEPQKDGKARGSSQCSSPSERNSLEPRSCSLELSNADLGLEQGVGMIQTKWSYCLISLHSYSQVFDPLCWQNLLSRVQSTPRAVLFMDNYPIADFHWEGKGRGLQCFYFDDLQKRSFLNFLLYPW